MLRRLRTEIGGGEWRIRRAIHVHIGHARQHEASRGRSIQEEGRASVREDGPGVHYVTPL